MTTKSQILKPQRFFFDLFPLLWMRNSKDTPFSFKIPNTVLFQNDLPVSWYFNAKNGSIKRKTKEKLTIPNIIRAFSKNKGQIVAVYFYSSDENKKIEFVRSDEVEKHENFKLIQEYVESIGMKDHFKQEDSSNILQFEVLTKETLASFLESSNKRMGVLQEYIQSSSDPDFSYRINWTLNLSKCEVRYARKKRHEKSFHFLERFLTFESDFLKNKTGLKLSRFGAFRLGLRHARKCSLPNS